LNPPVALVVTVVIIGFPSGPYVLGHETCRVTGVVSGTLLTSTCPAIEALTNYWALTDPKVKVEILATGVPVKFTVWLSFSPLMSES
jgi:hypothetical protein